MSKVLISVFVGFLLLVSLLFFIIEKNTQYKIDLILESNLSNLETYHKIIMHNINKKDFLNTFSRDNILVKYYSKIEDKNYLYIYKKSKKLENIKNSIDKKIERAKKFVLYTEIDEQSTVISFYPIIDNINTKSVDWIVSYSDTKLIDTLLRQKNLILKITFFIHLILAYFIYKNINQQQLIKNNEQKLLEKTQEQDTLLSLFDHGESVLFKWNNDKDWTVSYVSLSVEKLLGYSVNDFLFNKINYSQCIHKNDLTNVLDEVNIGSKLKGNFFIHKPYRILTKDNKQKWVLDYTIVLRNINNEITHYLGYIVDITEQKEKDELFLVQSKNAAMGEMIANIAHQWRQPLSVIASAATGMKLQKEFNILSDKEFEDTCEIINENVQYLSQTIEDFSDFIKGNTIKKLFSINDNISKFICLVEPLIKNYNINVVLNLENNVMITNYPNYLNQCFMNIFNNSKDVLSKFNESDSVRLFIITLYKKDDYVVIKLKDNAGGIPENILPKIFEPYFTTKHKSQGTGLGLYMTYNLITAAMHGSIEAKNVEFSYEGGNYIGSEFTIVLPI